MDLINKYGLDQATPTNFQSRMEAVVGRLEQGAIRGKSVVLRHSSKRPACVLLTSIGHREDLSDILYRISVDFDRKVLSIGCAFLDNAGLYTLKSREHRVMGCRYSLTYNQRNKDLQLKVNPHNGEVMFCYTGAVADTIEELEKNLPQLIMDVLEKLKVKARETKISLEEHIFEKLDEKKCYPDQAMTPLIDRIGKCVQLSSRSTWHMLSALNKKVENVFRKGTQDLGVMNNGKAKPPTLSEPIWKIFQGRSSSEFQVANCKEEEEIATSCARAAIETSKKEEQLRNLPQEKQFPNKIPLENGKEGYIASFTSPTNNERLTLRFEKNSDINLMKRERNTLKKVKDLVLLPGLPVYYTFGKLDELAEYRITNLSERCEPYIRYLERNKRTMSLFTKLDMLKQVILTMVQCKARSMLIGRIAPSSIRLEPGLQVKIFDLSRSYVTADLQRGKLPETPRDSFYVLPMQEGDEREDSYSFGLLFYRTIFGCLPNNIPSPLKKQYARATPLMAIEKFETFGPRQLSRLMGLLSLKCTQLRNIRKQQKQFQSLTTVPFQDWLLVCLTFMTRHLQ